ncbi:Mu transposase domain-containing protein [Kribbella sp. NBC_00359]|uniref:Mu transposase domain-containing protein n=1 Tax=Kribbella sp. NBC_00359 TaxID=2975966 RepID=UPI003FA5C4BB
MLALPLAPPSIGWTNRIRLPRDYYVRIASNDYSVDPSVVGRFVDVDAGPGRGNDHLCWSACGRHQRCWARHQTITDAAHRQTAHRLAHQASAARDDALTAGPATKSHVVVERRDLALYDVVFGITNNHGTWPDGHPRSSSLHRLQREVSARESHDGEGRIGAARFPARKASRSSTSTTPADSNATPSPTSAPRASSPANKTSSSSAHPAPA